MPYVGPLLPSKTIDKVIRDLENENRLLRDKIERIETIFNSIEEEFAALAGEISLMSRAL